MKPYSKDLRIRVLATVDHGVPREEVAKAFSVSVATIKRWLRRRRQTADVEPKPIPGRPSRKGVILRGWLPGRLEANNDLPLQEHREAFEEEFGKVVSTPTVGRAIARLPDGGWPIKKVEGSPRARRAGAGPAAVASLQLQREKASVRGRVRVQHLGDAPESSGTQRRAAYGKVPRNRGKNTTLITAITLEGSMGESVTIEAATDAKVFEAYVEELLAPTLFDGQVVLDRLGAHRTQRVRELV